jgi:hypothetical protein
VGRTAVFSAPRDLQIPRGALFLPDQSDGTRVTPVGGLVGHLGWIGGGDRPFVWRAEAPSLLIAMDHRHGSPMHNALGSASSPARAGAERRPVTADRTCQAPPLPPGRWRGLTTSVSRWIIPVFHRPPGRRSRNTRAGLAWASCGSHLPDDARRGRLRLTATLLFGAVHVCAPAREDGRYLTGARVSAGIDTALRLAARLTCDDLARAVQLGIECDPHPPHGPSTGLTSTGTCWPCRLRGTRARRSPGSPRCWPGSLPSPRGPLTQCWARIRGTRSAWHGCGRPSVGQPATGRCAAGPTCFADCTTQAGAWTVNEGGTAVAAVLKTDLDTCRGRTRVAPESRCVSWRSWRTVTARWGRGGGGR